MSRTDTPHDMRVVGTELLPPGTVVGRHRVAGKIAEGTHAILYMGEHVETSAKVAIKVLRWAWARHPEAIARFNREAHVMGRLAAANNVVHVHDIGDSPDGRRYLVMEFVRGRELSLILSNAKHRSEPTDIERACVIARDVAAALRDAHGKGVVHRDVKPSNIMVVREPDGREQAKLVDFGVSSDLESKAVGADLTVAGSVIGTQEYMAPEQAVGLPAAPAMDIFALGVVLFEMLTSQLPPAEALRGGLVPPASTLRPGVPLSLDELVRDCLQFDPRARPNTAIEVITRLGIVLDELRGRLSAPNKWAEGRPLKAAGAIESESEEGPWPGEDDLTVARMPAPEVPRRAPWVAIAIASVLVVVIGVGAWVLVDRDERVEPDPATPAPAAVGSVGVGDEGAPAVATPVEPRPSPSEVVPSEVSPSEVSPSEVSPSEVSPSELSPGKATKPMTPGKARPTTPGKSTGPAPSDPECVTARESASRAAGKLAWREVLQHSAQSSCWASSIERARLRVEAFAELGRFEECVRAGGSSSDAKVSKVVDFCRKRLDAG
jgi:eukaryotic-like serine/threonine-protein kinase